MAPLKYYFAAQVVLLFNLYFMSAEEAFHGEPPVPPHITPNKLKPYIASGSGRITRISGKIKRQDPVKPRNDQNKDMNDLLYAIYKKFHKDVPKEVSEHADVAKKTVDANAVEQKDEHKEADHVKKAKRTMALHELENVIDKLIVSLSDDNKNNKLETKDINKGMEDISKLAALAHLNLDKKDDTASKIPNKDAEKKDSSSKAQYHDESKWLTMEEIKKFADINGIRTSAKDDAHVAETNVGGVESFKDFKERFYKSFLNEDISSSNEEKRQGHIVFSGKDISSSNEEKRQGYGGGEASLVFHGKDGRKIVPSKRQLLEHGKDSDTNDVNEKELRDIVKLYNELKEETVADEDKGHAKRTKDQSKRKVKIETVKKDLMSLFNDLSDDKKSSSDDENTELAIGAKQKVSDDDEAQVKKRLVSLMHSLEARLTNGQSDNHSSVKLNDRIENELDSLAAGSVNNNKKSNEELLEALKGFKVLS